MIPWSFGELAKNNDCKSEKTGVGRIQIADQLRSTRRYYKN